MLLLNLSDGGREGWGGGGEGEGLDLGLTGGEEREAALLQHLLGV